MVIYYVIAVAVHVNKTFGKNIYIQRVTSYIYPRQCIFLILNIFEVQFRITVITDSQRNYNIKIHTIVFIGLAKHKI